MRAEHCYSRGAGGWIPVTDQDGRPSRALLYVAGDAAGVAGVAAATTGGMLAGLACAFDLGAAAPPRLKRRMESLRHQLRGVRWGLSRAREIAGEIAEDKAAVRTLVRELFGEDVDRLGRVLRRRQACRLHSRGLGGSFDNFRECVAQRNRTQQSGQTIARGRDQKCVPPPKAKN